METKEKLAISMKGNINSRNQPTAIPVEITDLKTVTVTKYLSARKAAEALNISNSTVMYKIKTLKPYKNRYVFKLCVD